MKFYFKLLIGIMLVAAVFDACKKKHGVEPEPGDLKSSAKAITRFSFASLSPAVEGVIDQTAMTVKAEVPSGTDLTKLAATIAVSDKATVSPASGAVQDFSKEVSYTVTAQDGSTQVYKVSVSRAASGSNVAVSSDQVIYYFTSEGKTDNTTGKYSSIKSIVAIDALTGKNVGSFGLGTEIPSNTAPYTSTYLPGPSGDGRQAYPVLVDNGLLYTFQAKKVSALDARTGLSKWSSEIEDYSSPDAGTSLPVVENGVLFVSGFLSKHIYALDSQTGKLKWDFAYTDQIRTFTASNGVLYVGYGDVNYSGGLLAIDIATTKEKWNLKTLGVVTNPAVVNGMVYYGDAKKKFYAVDAATGTAKWEFQAGGIVLTSPTVSDGTVYVSSEDRKLYALDASTGTKKWEYTAAGFKDSYAGLATDTDNVYFSAYNGTAFVICALAKKTGSKKWEVSASGQSVPVVAGGILYFGQQAFDAATGTNKNWGLKNMSQALNGPCIVMKGKMYVSSNSGMMQ